MRAGLFALLLGGCALLGGSALLGGCAHQAAKPPPMAQIEAALALDVAGGKGRAGGLAGKVVLVDFFATWCFPCIAELPLLERLQRENEAGGFTVIAVGMDLEGGKVLRPFAENYAPPYPVLVADEKIRSGQSLFGPIQALPTYFLFDREGRLIVAYQGLAEPAKLLEVVRRAVSR